MKKFNKQIAEAVNRGIQLALDDYQDDELNGSLSHISDVINSEDVIKNKLNLMKNFVDLDLPSGTLWAKCNIGANSEIEYGNYYAWGEVEANKEKYDWSTYKFAWNGSSHNLTKYV